MASFRNQYPDNRSWHTSSDPDSLLMLRLRQLQHANPIVTGASITPQPEQDHLLDPEIRPPDGVRHQHHHKSVNDHSRERPWRKQSAYSGTSVLVAFAAGCAVPTVLYAVAGHLALLRPPSAGDCRISFGTFHGREYRGPDTVGPGTCLVESKFLKVQQHRVRLKGTGDEVDAAVIPDWLWIDYHDRINVLVEAPPSSSSFSSSDPPRFLVFEQTKYALEGELSLAIVGGIIEPGEEAPHAAQREVREELRLSCRGWQFLGRYRTDVNRGIGWTHTFVASTCAPAAATALAPRTAGAEEEVGAADAERQDVKTLTLTELREAVQAGRFLEIQWSATVALALLHLESQHKNQAR